MGVADLEQGRRLAKVYLQRILVPPGEGVSLEQVDEGGRRAGDGAQPFLALGKGRQRPKQRPGVGVAWIVEDLLRRANLHDLSGVHHRHPIGHPCHHPQVMGDEHGSCVQLPLDVSERIQNLRLNGHVQRGGRLVGK